MRPADRKARDHLNMSGTPKHGGWHWRMRSAGRRDGTRSVPNMAGGLDALVRRPHLHGIFHLCDDEPAPPQDVTAFAASLLGIEPPPEVPFEEAGLSRMARSFYSECKRVSNARAKAALGWRPLYPTYREGLSAVLAAESG